MIYLASPYSHESTAVREARYIAARNIAADMIAEGDCVFSPIVYGHRMAEELGLPTTAFAWKTFNDEMIILCDKVIVLCLQGWNESVGVKAEIELANEIGRPVEYLTPGA